MDLYHSELQSYSHQIKRLIPRENEFISELLRLANSTISQLQIRVQNLKEFQCNKKEAWKKTEEEMQNDLQFRGVSDGNISQISSYFETFLQLLNVAPMNSLLAHLMQHFGSYSEFTYSDEVVNGCAAILSQLSPLLKQVRRNTSIKFRNCIYYFSRSCILLQLCTQDVNLTSLVQIIA